MELIHALINNWWAIAFFLAVGIARKATKG